MRRKKCGQVFLVCICYLLLPGAAVCFSQETGASTSASIDIIRQAKNLMRAGEYEAAHDLLYPIYEKERDNRVAFMLGLCCVHFKEYSDAISYFQRILKAEPNNNRVRLELARAYLLAGGEEQKALAKKELLAVKAANPPPLVGQNIERFLDIIEGRAPGVGRHKWIAQITARLMYDSNANGGPSSSSILLFGQYTPNTDKEISDTADKTSLYFGHVFSFTDSYVWQSDISFTHTGYHGYHEYNADVLNVSSGPSFKSGKFLFSLPVLFEKYEVGSDRYTTTYAAAPQFRYPLTDELNANLILRGMKRDYTRGGDIGRDADVWAAEYYFLYSFGRDNFVKAGGVYGKEDADRDYYDNYFSEAYAGVCVNLPYDLLFYAQQNVKCLGYEACEPAFSELRKDTQYTSHLNLKKEFGKSGWSISFAYTYTFDDSNLDFYKYKRHQGMFSVSKILGTPAP